MFLGLLFHKLANWGANMGSIPIHELSVWLLNYINVMNTNTQGITESNLAK